MFRPFKYASAVLLTMMFYACAETEDNPAGVTGTDAGSDAGSIVVKDAAPAQTQDTGSAQKVCVAQCQTDSECQQSCPAATEIYCCDVSSGVCFKHSQTSCPVPNTNDGGQQTTY